jgi:hydrogenase expression/formation protein HypC
MCYAIPAKILNITKDNATVDYGGVHKQVNITLVDHAVVGDFVLIHAGFAIEKIEKKSAEEALAIIRRDMKRPAQEPIPKIENKNAVTQTAPRI